MSQVLDPCFFCVVYLARFYLFFVGFFLEKFTSHEAIDDPIVSAMFITVMLVGFTGFWLDLFLED